MYCYVLIEVHNGKVVGVWTYVRPIDAYSQYKILKAKGALDLIIVKSIMGQLVEHSAPGQILSEGQMDTEEHRQQTDDVGRR